MSIKVKLVLFSCALIVLSCSKQPNKIIPELFNRHSFADSSSLVGEFITFNEPINYPLYFYVLKDSVIIAVKGSADPYYVELYNLNTKELINKIAKRGKGPNEFLAATFRDKNSSDNIFFLRDVVKSEFYFYNIDSILNGNIEPFNGIKAPNYVHDCDVLNNDTLVCYNHYYFEKDKYSNGVRPLFYLNRSERLKNQQDESLIGKYFTANVSSSYVYVSSLKDRVFLFDRSIDNIKIFNKKLEFKRELIGPDQINAEYKLEENNLVSFKEDSDSYRNICTTDSAIYALLNPINKPLELFKFDWDGNLIHRYKLDKFIYGMSVDSKGEYLYGSHYEENFGEYPKLIRYKLK